MKSSQHNLLISLHCRGHLLPMQNCLHIAQRITTQMNMSQFQKNLLTNPTTIPPPIYILKQHGHYEYYVHSKGMLQIHIYMQYWGAALSPLSCCKLLIACILFLLKSHFSNTEILYNKTPIHAVSIVSIRCFHFRLNVLITMQL